MTATPIPPAAEPVAEALPLSQPARVINTFFLPRKTFTDLRRSASWWLPFLISAAVSVAFIYVVGQKVGFRKAIENQIRTQPKLADRIEHMPVDRREEALQPNMIWVYASPVVTPLISYAIVAAVLLATLKFGALADMKYKTLFALIIYASLPGLVKSLLAILSLLAGAGGDAFTLQDPVASSPGYFINPTGSPMLHSLLSSLDIFTIWTLILTAIGITCISKVKRVAAFTVVFGWFGVVVLIRTAVTNIARTWR